MPVRFEPDQIYSSEEVARMLETTVIVLRKQHCPFTQLQRQGGPAFAYGDRITEWLRKKEPGHLARRTDDT